MTVHTITAMTKRREIGGYMDYFIDPNTNAVTTTGVVTLVVLVLFASYGIYKLAR